MLSLRHQRLNGEFRRDVFLARSRGVFAFLPSVFHRISGAKNWRVLLAALCLGFMITEQLMAGTTSETKGHRTEPASKAFLGSVWCQLLQIDSNFGRIFDAFMHRLPGGQSNRPCFSAIADFPADDNDLDDDDPSPDPAILNASNDVCFCPSDWRLFRPDPQQAESVIQFRENPPP